jgi:hypothetical protein
MKKITLILCAIILITPTFVFAQVAAPPTGPLITSINPSSGEQGQNVGLVISGQNFQNGAQVSFNPASGISIISTQFITATEIRTNISISADAPLLARDVIVTNPQQPTGTFLQGFTVMPASDTTPPPPILGLTATDALDGKVDLAWIKSDVEDFGRYAIYLEETEFVNVTGITPLTTISNQITTTFQATELTNGTKYFFAVTAIDTSGNEDKNVLPVNAIPTISTVPPVTIPFPTSPAANVTPAPAPPTQMEKTSGEATPLGLISIIIIITLAALSGAIYSIFKNKSKKISKDKKTEIKKEEELRFLNKNSKLVKLKIMSSEGRVVDLIEEIINLMAPNSSPPESGIPLDFALKTLDVQKDVLLKTLGQIPSKGKNLFEYSITITPVSGADVEWQMAEISLGGGLQPSGKYEIKKQGNDFTYTKDVEVMKGSDAWKKYADDAAPDFIDLKKIIKVHIDDLGRQEEKFKKL